MTCHNLIFTCVGWAYFQISAENTTAWYLDSTCYEAYVLDILDLFSWVYTCFQVSILQPCNPVRLRVHRYSIHTHKWSTEKNVIQTVFTSLKFTADESSLAMISSTGVAFLIIVAVVFVLSILAIVWYMVKKVPISSILPAQCRLEICTVLCHLTWAILYLTSIVYLT